MSITDDFADSKDKGGCPRANIVYLNFCSIPTRLDRHTASDGKHPMDHLVDHLNNKGPEPTNKEMILRFIAGLIRSGVHVLLSLFITTPHQNGAPKWVKHVLWQEYLTANRYPYPSATAEHAFSYFMCRPEGRQAR